MNRIINKLTPFFLIDRDKNRRQLLKEKRKRIRGENQTAVNLSVISFFLLLILECWKLFLPIESIAFVFCTLASYIIILERVMSFTIQFVEILGVLINQKASLTKTEKKESNFKKLSYYLKLPNFYLAVTINNVSCFLFTGALMLQVSFSVLSTNGLLLFYNFLVLFLFVLFVSTVIWKKYFSGLQEVTSLVRESRFLFFSVILQWLLVILCCSVFLFFHSLFLKYEGILLVCIFILWSVYIFRKSIRIRQNEC